MKAYKGSPDEEDDLKNYFIRFEGNLDHVYECVIGSNPEVDDERFRLLIDRWIAEKVPCESILLIIRRLSRFHAMSKRKKLPSEKESKERSGNEKNLMTKVARRVKPTFEVSSLPKVKVAAAFLIPWRRNIQSPPPRRAVQSGAESESGLEYIILSWAKSYFANVQILLDSC
jgi:hypothetical protein